MIPFKVQFDKLTEAYISGKVNPYVSCACFVGNLLNGSTRWEKGRDFNCGNSHVLGYEHYDQISHAMESIKEMSDSTYSLWEVVELERIFIQELQKVTMGRDVAYWAWLEGKVLVGATCYHDPKFQQKMEDALFSAFQVTLDALREIHISKGENVDEFTFTKRKLEIA